MNGNDFVIAAYALTYLVLGGYGVLVWRRFRRAERAQDLGTQGDSA